MLKVAPSDLLDLWKRAVPLAKARVLFAPQDLQDEFARHPERELASALSGVMTGHSTNLALLKAMSAEVKEVNAANSLRADLQRKMDHAVFQRFCDGELICLGFNAPRSLDSVPVEVPFDALRYLPNWEKGDYRQEGLNLIELRLLAVESAAPSALPGRALPPPGRPSFKREILAAFHDLRSKGVFIDKPLTHGIAQIQAWIRENAPDSRAARSTLSEEAIRKCIRPELDAAKAASSNKL